MSRKAFTLIELLIVVLIIGILSAIAIPMYQGAVDKSHWSTMLPGAKAIKDAEEAIKMSNGEYTSEMANLDVTMENNDLTFNLITPNNTSDPNVIGVTNSKLANVRLASYLDDSPKFAGQLHCEAKTGDERANRLCGKLLMGQELNATEGYTRYLLDQSIDSTTCGQASLVWSNNKTTCYKSAEERCTANGATYADGECKTTGNITGKVLEGTVCKGGFHNHCKDATFTDQSVCIPGGTHYNESCSGSTFDNSICLARGDYGRNCGNDTSFTNGSVCYAFADYSGWGCGRASYDETSCCCGGASCPAKYRCPESRCDPKYLNYQF